MAIPDFQSFSALVDVAADGKEHFMKSYFVQANVLIRKTKRV
jgi:hypothetical protein